MRVLLLSANREDFPDPVYPLGVSLVADAARRAGHEVEVVDLRWAPDLLPGAVTAFGPDVVGIGIRNVDNLTWGRSRSYVGELREVVGAVRRAFCGPVVLGGSGYSLFPGKLLEALDVPYGVVGEGERVFPALLACLQEGRSPAGLAGVVVAGGGDLRPVADRPLLAPGRYALPLDLVGRYAETGAAVGVQGKRGCPFECVYCTYPTIEGRGLRLREASDVVQEVGELAAAGVRKVFFVDDAFNVPPEHAEAICRGLVESGVRISWTAFAHPRNFSPSLAGWMKRSGCAGLEFGTDSLADPVLRELNKGFSVADVRAAAAVAAAQGIPAAHYLLFGGPGETADTVEQTFRTADALPRSACIAMVGVRLYPGTPLTARAQTEGVVAPDQELLEPAFYLSPRIDPAAVLTRLEAHAHARKSWIVPALGIRSDPRVLERLRRKDGPTWGAVAR